MLAAAAKSKPKQTAVINKPPKKATASKKKATLEKKAATAKKFKEAGKA